MSRSEYTIQKHEWQAGDQPFVSFFAEATGPVTGHAETEKEAVEALANNLESMAKAIRTGEIYFVKVGYRDTPGEEE